MLSWQLVYPEHDKLLQTNQSINVSDTEQRHKACRSFMYLYDSCWFLEGLLLHTKSALYHSKHPYPSPFSALAFWYHLSPTSLLCCWWPTQQLPAQPGVQASLCTTIACCGSCCQNRHGGTGRNTETGSTGKPGPRSLYTGDNVLLERVLFAGGECSVLWFPIHLYWDLFMHSQAGMHYEGEILITAPQENRFTSPS